MLNLVVVNKKKDWPYSTDNIEIITAKAYLTDTKYSELKNVRVFNMCRSYRYQSVGYYVSLLAKARSHKVFPSITTIQDLKSPTLIRIITDEIDDLIQKSFHRLTSTNFTLSVYFGKNISPQYDKLAKQLSALFQAPLLRAQFSYKKKWVLQDVSPVPLNEIPETHLDYVGLFAKEYFCRKRIDIARKTPAVYDLAILYNPNDKNPPSNEKALIQFIHSAEDSGFNVELITKDDFARLREFDALFIRDTTAVNHYTYRFSRRAFAEGLVVMDDPDSIVKCTNKVYLAELLAKAKVSMPRTLIVHKDNKNHIIQELGLPCVLKQPDSSFSQGVIKVSDEKELTHEVENFLEKSDLIVCQEYIPTQYDWRIGILDKKPLYACKYYMAKDHWQIYNWSEDEENNNGSFDTLPLELVPTKVIKTALKAANLIGDGFYGVDLKEIDGEVYVIEVNDNPSIDAGVEDIILKDDLYKAVIQCLLSRISEKHNHKTS